MNKRNRHRPPGRRAPYCEQKRRFLILCEGEVTEVQYFRAFEKWRRSALLELPNLEIDGLGNATIKLVREAKQRKQAALAQAKSEKDDNLAYDQVWCVFDVDDHPDLGAAKVMARDNEIQLAISNPCFELWLLLHLRGDPGQKSREKIKEMLAAETTTSKTNKTVDFEKLKPGYVEAVKKATQLDEQAARDQEEGRNPTTSVYLLTEAISIEKRN
jgi:RloB-like protein